MIEFSEVLLNAERYGTDVQFRMQCPFCNARERSFAACRRSDGTVVYICHRAKCGEKGSIQTVGGVFESGDKRSEKPKEQRYLNLRDLTTDDQDVLVAKWNFSSRYALPVEWKWDVESNRLAMPITGPRGERRGYVLRTLNKFTSPKVLSVKLETSQPWIHWAMPGYTGVSPIIVEDVPSAHRIAKYGQVGVALLGTHISDEALQEITTTKVLEKRRITIALDEDASVKALEYQKQLGAHFDRVCVILLTKDIKDMTGDELSQCLNGI